MGAYCGSLVRTHAILAPSPPIHTTLAPQGKGNIVAIFPWDGHLNVLGRIVTEQSSSADWMFGFSPRLSPAPAVGN